MIKKILFLSFICLSALSFAQQKSKAKPKTNIPLIKKQPKTNVPILTDADELLVIKSNEPNPNDLLDITVSIQKPKTPNAGQSITNEIGLNGEFTFNKKIGFSVNAPEGDLVSYFYFNTKNGYAMLDWKGIKAMLTENPEGEMTQIKNANNDFYQYLKSSEGNFVLKAGSGQSMVVHDIQTEMLSKEFFKTFKKTGNKVGKIGGNKYPRVEYSGTFEGKKMSIWLSNPQDVLLDTKFTHSLSGYWGLGFIASPSGTAYMITGIVGDGASIFMNYIENANVSFSGKGYKPVGEMTGGNAGAFSQTSDIQDLPFVDQVNNADATANYYDMMISLVNQSIAEHQSGLKEAQKNNDATAIKRHNCLITCTKNEKTRLEKVKEEHIKIINQYKNDDEKRDEKINQLMETQGMPKPCSC
ncbi:hypothetical protein [Flavobacterium sp.]|uniref:hypothetical protein n=1 Tax=Flavobacterium sp. TaxID=239 RepID=UPI0022CA519C|nr:hypothetical protein [Flavobacterium sp.]MCZ8091841.1 hypothetical protein [Flavobacterium sp.]